MTEEQRPAGEPEGPEKGGDPACWLDRVCPECGRFAEGPGTVCEQCGHELVI